MLFCDLDSAPLCQAGASAIISSNFKLAFCHNPRARQPTAAKQTPSKIKKKQYLIYFFPFSGEFSLILLRVKRGRKLKKSAQNKEEPSSEQIGPWTFEIHIWVYSWHAVIFFATKFLNHKITSSLFIFGLRISGLARVSGRMCECFTGCDSSVSQFPHDGSSVTH